MQYPDVLKTLDETLALYQSTEVPRGNKPVDPRSNPKYFDYTWTNWWDYVSHDTVKEEFNGFDDFYVTSEMVNQ